jgi:Na+-transporting methylmalonyl-CoA/oxaloacetate decarboxylase gamma subunit
MQEDLRDVLEETKDASLSEISDAGEGSASAGGIENFEAYSSKNSHPNKAGANLADYLQAARERAMESKREFEKSLQTVREQDPALARKTKQVGVGIALLVLIFIIVLIKSITDTGQNASPAAEKTDANQAVAGQSEADRVRAAQDVNDKLRAENLTRIAELAVVYHLEQKADLPITASYAKLNETNPVSQYLRQALSRYGQSAAILLDPKNPEFYYAYRSADGRSIELSARMENEAGRYCEYGQSPCIYKVAITEAQMQEMNLDLERYK